MNGKSIVIIPTYNELDNLHMLIPDLRARYPFLDILVVDDNSPDGT
ncbi:MAG: glycosyltransferase, partial [Clostridiales bacterium]